VAPLKEAEIIVGENLPEEVLIDYLEDNKDIARAIGKPVYLGGWFDKDSNQYFLDNTLIVPTVEEALYIAEAAEQLAIFDLNNFEEIRTDAGIRGLQQSGAYSSDTAVGYKGRLAEVGRRFAEARNNRNAREKEQLVGPGSETLVSFANKLLELRGIRPYNIVTSEETAKLWRRSWPQRLRLRCCRAVMLWAGTTPP
jgi:hypothetical protein